MAANFQASHHMMSQLRRRISPYPNRTKTLPNQSNGNRKRFKSASLSERGGGGGGRGSALVQQRPPNTNTPADEEEVMGIMVIDQTADVGVLGRRSEKNDDDDDDVRSVEVDEGLLVREYGWKVRRMVEEMSEMKEVAQIQAEAFHEPSLFFDDFFFHFFQAEVHSGLLYRLRNSPPDRYACLVAEPEEEGDEESSANPRGPQQLVGVVDVTVLRDSDVLRHLVGAYEYLYVSGIAVSSQHRRQKVATALLKACEAMSVLWGHEHLVLRAYEDDKGARALYANAGYRLVARDPPWVTWIGRKRRVLMVKRVW